jgi:hypothetical protein
MYFSIVPPPAFTGDATSLFVGGAPFAPYVMTFVAIMLFGNNNKL